MSPAEAQHTWHVNLFTESIIFVSIFKQNIVISYHWLKKLIFSVAGYNARPSNLGAVRVFSINETLHTSCQPVREIAVLEDC